MQVNGEMKAKLERLEAWLRETNPQAAEFDWDANLLAEGILDSFQFVNFLLQIERIRETPIDREKINPEAFRTLNVIGENFFSQAVIV